MKKLILIMVMIALMAISAGGGYFVGYQAADNIRLSYIADNPPAPKDVTYAEVMQFIEDDKTNEQEYNLQTFDCDDIARTVKENANYNGIRCGLVLLSMDYKYAHAINCFNTTDKGLVYLEGEHDLLLDGIEVGGNFIQSLNRAETAKGDESTQVMPQEVPLFRIVKINRIW
jgi:hypothetical protein